MTYLLSFLLFIHFFHTESPLLIETSLITLILCVLLLLLLLLLFIFIYKGLQLMLDDDSASCDATKYRHNIGSLQYLSLTRPDLGFVVNCLAQFMHKPTVMHWQHVKWPLRYVKQTIHFDFLLPLANQTQCFGSSQMLTGVVIFMITSPSWLI